MPWTITEKHLSGRLGPKKNEDRYFFYPSAEAPDVFGVIDGATPLNPEWRSKRGLTAAQLTAEMVEQYAVRIGPHTKPQAWFAELLQGILAMRDQEGVPHDIGDGNPELTIATFIIYNGYRKELWRRGDCEFALGFKDGSFTVTAPPQSLKEVTYCTLRSARLKAMLELPENADWEKNPATRIRLAMAGREVVARQRRLDVARIVAGQTNYPHYTPWENEAGVTPQLDIFTVGVDVTTLVLASDGFPKLFRSKDATVFYRKEVNCRDPFHIGMNGNADITPKGGVDHLTGDIVGQGDDEAAIWATFKPHLRTVA